MSRAPADTHSPRESGIQCLYFFCFRSRAPWVKVRDRPHAARYLRAPAPLHEPQCGEMAPAPNLQAILD